MATGIIAVDTHPQSFMLPPILPAVAEVCFWIALGMFVMVSVRWLHGKTHDTRAAA